MEIIYVILAYFCSIFGIVAGVYFLWIAWLQSDKIQGLNLGALGFLYASLGIIYWFTVIIPKEFAPVSEVQMWLRPINVLLILVPSLIAVRAKL